MKIANMVVWPFLSALSAACLFGCGGSQTGTSGGEQIFEHHFGSRLMLAIEH